MKIQPSLLNCIEREAMVHMQTEKRGILMRKRIWFLIIISAVCMAGCDTGEYEGEDSYDDMTAKYTLLTVSELWAAFISSDGDCDGSYVLVKGVLLSVGTNSITLLDTGTNKAVTCKFDTGIDLTDLENVLSNNISTDDEDTVTIGGVCHYYEDTTSYPYLDSCDYFYVNEDA